MARKVFLPNQSEPHLSHVHEAVQGYVHSVALGSGAAIWARLAAAHVNKAAEPPQPVELVLDELLTRQPSPTPTPRHRRPHENHPPQPLRKTQWRW